MKRSDVELIGVSLGVFHPLELQARVSARLRKLEDAQTHADQFNIGPFHIRTGSQKISLITPDGDLKLELTGNQFKILFYLIRRMDQIISREELLKEIWGADVNVSARTIDTHVYAIRRELGVWSKLITSVPAKGFRLSLKQVLEKKPSA
jgi:two-component system phosphate regulon response regulator PhoB